MKLVTLTRDIRPWQARDDVYLPDDIADGLVEEGSACNPRPYPASAGTPPAPAKRLLTRAKKEG